MGVKKLWVVLAALGMCGELLPKPRHVQGVVVDQKGRPISGAWVYQNHDHYSARMSDERGHFDLNTNSTVLVIRKAGFHSGILRASEANLFSVVLLTTGRPKPYPTCPADGSAEGIGGIFNFQIPASSGLKVSEVNYGVDSHSRSYGADASKGTKGILHGIGSAWSFGFPSDQEIWSSTRYEETTFQIGRYPIVDGKGQTKDGNWWRYLGWAGESASYSHMNEKAAKLLDQVLDSACLKLY